MQKSLIIFFFFSSFLLACKPKGNKADDSRYTPNPYVKLKHPDWTKSATIYEVNIRQYTREGTFAAFATHLNRLKEMGVDIIWLMPIHPIGEKNRKGKLGSYYSIKDYYGINPEFGTLNDFKDLVKKIHALGMHVIIDWVGNHSAWDNPLTKEHPEWYTKTKSGNFQPTPWYDWDDVIDFDYDQPGLRKYMTEVMKYWIRDLDIDGYRCDVGGFIPVDFWENLREELDAVKPVFMLAEWESRDLHAKAFDMTYAWSLWDKMKDAATGNKGISGLIEYMAHDVNTFPKDAYRMTFTDNHDMNSWNGNPYLNFGPALETAIVFSNLVNGMPLIYSGQEAGLHRSLAFFEKDSIDWTPNSNAALFKKLFTLKHQNQAIWNGAYGGEMIRVYNSKMNQVISFFRTRQQQAVFPIINFSAQPVAVTLFTKDFKGKYAEFFSNETYTIGDSLQISLKPWEYKVLTQ